LEERPDIVPTDKGFRQKRLPLLLHLKLVEDIQGIGASHWGSRSALLTEVLSEAEGEPMQVEDTFERPCERI